MASKRRKAAAAEDEKSRLKSPAKRSSRRKAQDGESPKGKVEAVCSHKTPKRSSRSRLPTFSSPANETDIQQEIFWDPQSPILHKLGNGKQKQTAVQSTVEISEIVNRIAPQEEKPSCYEGSLLGMWIGDDAIPCTPGIAKVRCWSKVNNTRSLRLKNKEEELMKLAKQFDKNLTEAIQEQAAPCHNATHLLSEAEGSVECQGDAQVENPQHLLGEHPQTDAALPFGVLKERNETAASCECSCQKPVDLDTEVALNALFDCTPQKWSGALSQGSSSSSLHSSQDTVLVEEHLLEEKTAGGFHGSVAMGTPQRHGSAPVSDRSGLTVAEKIKMVFEQATPSTAVSKTEQQSAVLSKTELAVSDFEDWEADLLTDDSFVMQITQNPELVRTPQNAFPSTLRESCETKGPTVTPDRPNIGCGAFPKSSNDVATLLTVQKQTHELGATMSVPLQSHFPFKNDIITSDSKSGQNKNSGCNSIPVKFENKCVTEGFTQLKSAIIPGNKAPSVSVHLNLSKTLTGKSKSNVLRSYSEPSSVLPNLKPKDQQGVADQTFSNHLQAGLPKKPASSFGDWNEARISDDVLELFCESDTLWGADCEDDDLLYQVCDDVERNTLSQDVTRVNVTTTLGVVSTDKQRLANCPLPQKCRKTFSLNAPLTSAALPKNENSADPSDQSRCVPYKTESMNGSQENLQRPNSMLDKGLASRSAFALMSNTCLNTNSSTRWQSVTWNAGKAQNISSGDQASNEKSKYAFRKTNSSQALILNHNSVGAEGYGGISLALGERKNGPNIPLHTALQVNPKTTFKRHLSDSFANFETEQKSGKCSQEEIARKKQEALERRKCKMQVLLKNTAPT